MAVPRRTAEESKALLIEAAVAIIRTEGYGALSARRLAERVGLKRQIVHYHFGTIEDLLLAVVRHYGDTGLARFAEAFESENPLQVIWEMEPDASATAYAFMAMASHHAAVGVEMRRYMADFRKLQTEAIAKYFAARKVKLGIPPTSVAIIVQSVSQALGAETTLRADAGHEETKTVMEELMKSLTLTGQFAVNTPRSAKKSSA